jgi:hypothetical protein
MKISSMQTRGDISKGEVTFLSKGKEKGKRHGNKEKITYA